MISLSGWRCAALIRPVLLWMGSRHEAQAVIAKSSASQNGNLECPEPQEKKGNVQVWESRKNCHPRNHRACHGQIQWHKCLQVFVERNAGRFIRGGSEKLCPKLSMALTGCFHLPMVPDSLGFFLLQFKRFQKKSEPRLQPLPGKFSFVLSNHVRVSLWSLQWSKVGKTEHSGEKSPPQVLGLPPSQMDLVGARHWGGQLVFSY